MSYHLDTGSRHSPLCIYDYDDIITSKLLAGAPTKCLTPALPSAAAHSLLRRLIWDSRESVRRIHPEPATEFMCYELVESTDFGPFLAKVGSSGLECTDDKYDETGYPKFVYDVVVVRKSQSLFDTAYTNDVSTPGFNGTFEFDAVRAAEGTLYSVYEEGKTQPQLQLLRHSRHLPHLHLRHLGHLRHLRHLRQAVPFPIQRKGCQSLLLLGHSW
jgi:hypothetical protein